MVVVEDITKGCLAFDFIRGLKVSQWGSLDSLRQCSANKETLAFPLANLLELCCGADSEADCFCGPIFWNVKIEVFGAGLSG